MSNRNFILGVLILSLYVVVGYFFVQQMWGKYPSTTPDDLKNLGVLLGLGAGFLGSLLTSILSFVTLSEQKTNAEKLATLQSQLAANNELLKTVYSVRTASFEKLIVAANLCYRELQHLGNGAFDPAAVKTSETKLFEAESLSANLDDNVQGVVKKLVQVMMNIADEATLVGETDPDKISKYKAIWVKNVPEFGALMLSLQNASPVKGFPVTR